VIARTAGIAALLSGLLFCATGCDDGPQHFWMVFDPCDPLILEPEAVTDEQLAAIERAIAMWNDVAEVNVGFTGPVDARRLRLEVIETEWYMGRFDDLEGEIEIASRVTDMDVFSIVVAHELGHAFGLYHVDAGDRVSVMNKGNKDVPPNPGDVDVLAHMWGSCIRGPITAPPTETLHP
jgi:hypothetical protein